MCRNCLKIHCSVGGVPKCIDCLISSRQASKIQEGALRRPPWFSLSALAGCLARSTGWHKAQTRRESLGKNMHPIARGQALRMESHQAPLSGQLSSHRALCFCLLWLPCSNVWSGRSPYLPRGLISRPKTVRMCLSRVLG